MVHRPQFILATFGPIILQKVFGCLRAIDKSQIIEVDKHIGKCDGWFDLGYTLGMFLDVGLMP